MSLPYYVVILHKFGSMPQLLESRCDMPKIFDTEQDAMSEAGTFCATLPKEGGVWGYKIVELKDKELC